MFQLMVLKSLYIAEVYVAIPRLIKINPIDIAFTAGLVTKN